MIHLVAQPFALALGHAQCARPAALGHAQCAAPAQPRAVIALSTVVIHQGDASLPPLVEADASPLPFGRIVKPFDADTLWQWQQEQGQLDADSSWASVWPAAAALATYVTAQPQAVRDRAVVDLGAGLGAVGLTAASFGASSVTLIDSDPLALHCAMATAVLNGIRTGPVPTADGDDGDGVATVSAAAADWADISRDPADPADAESLTLCADVVLCAEVLYDANEVSALARCVATLLRRGGSLLLSDPERERALGCRNAFMRELAGLGAEVVAEPLPPAPGLADAEPIVLVRAEFAPSSRL